MFVRKVGKHLMVPMGDDWITLKHYLRLLDHGAVSHITQTFSMCCPTPLDSSQAPSANTRELKAEVEQNKQRARQASLRRRADAKTAELDRRKREAEIQELRDQQQQLEVCFLSLCCSAELSFWRTDSFSRHTFRSKASGNSKPRRKSSGCESTRCPRSVSLRNKSPLQTKRSSR